MVLHTAAHLFQDGEIKGGVKDLLDIQGQLETFAGQDGFFARLLERARRLELGRPLYYALRYAQSLLDAPIPHGGPPGARAMGPPATVVALMDRLVPGCSTRTTRSAASPWSASGSSTCAPTGCGCLRACSRAT